MHTTTDVLKVVAAILGSLVVLSLVVTGLIMTGFGQMLPLLVFLMLAVGWLVYAYLRYRQVRQDELLQVITAAVEARLPLAPAIRAYVRDRPHEGEGSVWDALLLFLIPPGYFLWQQRHSFDRRAADVAELLDDGLSLPEALAEVRGVAPREVMIAAAVGETTGRLAACLRKADRERLAGAWLEVVPRLMYPLLLLLFIGGITSFLMISIMPRMQRILTDFDEPVPAVTARLIEIWRVCSDYHLAAAAAVPVLILLISLPIASPALRWHMPLLGRLFRWETQGLVLRMLGSLIEVGRPVPEALGLLAGAADLPGVGRRCLEAAQRAVVRGEPLATALRRAGLLPRSMVPLVEAAERTRTLPWALTELGELLAGRAVRTARRFSQVASPALVVAVGSLVGFITVAMFMPLIQLLTRLSE